MHKFGKGEDPELKATPQVQEIANKVKKEVEERLNTQFKKFKAVKFIQQGYNGINYKIKVEVDRGSYIHLVVEEYFAREGGTKLALDVVTEGKTLSNPLIGWG